MLAGYKTLTAIYLASLAAAPAVAQYYDDNDDSYTDGNERVHIKIKSTWDETMGRAEDAMESEDYTTAGALFDKVIAYYAKTYPGDTAYCAANKDQALSLAGMILSTRQDRPEDITILGPEWCNALSFKATMLTMLHRSDDALPLMQKAVALAPFDAGYMNDLGDYCLDKQDWHCAFEQFSMASNTASHAYTQTPGLVHAKSLRALGYTEIRLNDLKKARDHLNQSAKIDPHNQDTEGLLAALDEAEGR